MATLVATGIIRIAPSPMMARHWLVEEPGKRIIGGRAITVAAPTSALGRLCGTHIIRPLRSRLAGRQDRAAGSRRPRSAQRLGERFFLHAHSIAFDSPATGERLTITAPLAPELESWLGEY